jgi:hypothetical protein
MLLVDIGAYENQELLRFVANHQSAHSDVGDALVSACDHLGEYAILCPEPRAYSYLGVVTNGICFAVAHGMDRVSIRLPEIFVQRALDSGAAREHELGSSWVTFVLFRSDWPSPDLRFWLLKAYAGARNRYAAPGSGSLRTTIG